MALRRHVPQIRAASFGELSDAEDETRGNGGYNGHLRANMKQDIVSGAVKKDTQSRQQK
jgi:hypothetical protein